MMYKSPIETIIAEIKREIAKRQEDDIYQIVQDIGIKVDKSELLKALAYDRGQYEKGYEDGAKALAENIKQGIAGWTDEFKRDEERKVAFFSLGITEYGVDCILKDLIGD